MTEPLYDIDQPTQAKIVAWREQVFERLGFNVLKGRALAMRRDIDTHAVAHALEGGATHAQALGIFL
jgi:hypothetical protein